jgi:hypothetical protein
MSAGLAMMLAAFGAMGLWAVTTGARAAGAMRPPPWARLHGRSIACVVLAAATAGSVVALGLAAATALLLCALMLSGSLVVPLLNAWPRPAMLASLGAAALSLPLSALAL